MYHVAVILTDAQKRILWVNDDFTYITGYTLAEAMGKKPGLLLQGPDTESDAVKRIRKNLQDQVTFKEIITNYRKNGEKYLCQLLIHPVYNDEQELVNYLAFEVDQDKTPANVDIPLMQLKDKYPSSSLRGIEEVKLYGQLKALMEGEKLFLDPDLSLKCIADRLNTNTKYLSQVVNHLSECNFQQFLNRYRVQALQEHLSVGRHRQLTLFGLAQQCGFKNKSTFFKVFKEVTGATPKAYVARLPR